MNQEESPFTGALVASPTDLMGRTFSFPFEGRVVYGIITLMHIDWPTKGNIQSARIMLPHGIHLRVDGQVVEGLVLSWFDMNASEWKLLFYTPSGEIAKMISVGRLCLYPTLEEIRAHRSKTFIGCKDL